MTGVLMGLGSAVPPRVITNDDLAARLDTTDEWIRSRTGIAQRHIADTDKATSELAVEAGALALKAAGDSPDLVLVSTTTPNYTCPGTAPEVAARLGLGNVPAMDIQAACAGFIYGLATASGLLECGAAHRVLLIGAETMTRIVNPDNRATAVLFGDGAGAALLRRGDPDEPGAVGPFDLGSDGNLRELVYVPAGGARRPVDHAALENRDTTLKMRGKEVYEQAVKRMTESSRTVLERAGLDVEDVDCFVGHQANARILDAVGDELGVPADRRFANVEHYGNTSSASIPLALADLELEPGRLVLLTAIGAGMVWGSTVLRWPELRRP